MNSLALTCPAPSSYLRRASRANATPFPPLLSRQVLMKSSCNCKSQRWMCSGSIRISCSSERVGKAISQNPHVASVAADSAEEPTENSSLAKGDMWSIHKFGGTCMGTSERIQTVANIVLGDPSERKLVVVSAMSKVTDMMYNLVYKAQSRDDSYMSALDDVYDKHMLTAKQLLDGDDIISFLSQLHNDITNLKAMLRAIYIAGHATESFLDFCCWSWRTMVCSNVVLCCKKVWKAVQLDGHSRGSYCEAYWFQSS